MVKLIRAHGSKPLFTLGFAEGLIFFACFYAGVHLSWVEISSASTINLAPKALLFTAVLLAMMFAMGLYHTRFLGRYISMMARVAVSLVLGALLLTALFYVFPEVQIWRSILVPALAFSFAGAAITRYFVQRLIGADRLRRRVAVFGVGGRAAHVEALERERRAFGFMCVGFVDPGVETISVPRSKIIGSPAQLLERLQTERIDELVIAAEGLRNPDDMRWLMELRLRGVAVTRYSEFYERETGSIDIDALDSTDFVFSEGLGSGRLQSGMKRALDVTVSIVFLIVFLPLLLGTAIAIRLESRGPVILRQERVGLGGRTFIVYKFRSMHVEAERDGVPRWASNDDPRVTRIGGFIRKVRIDELPQLFNVLQGHMSFVGPRPERPYFVEQLSEQIPFYSERHLVKPGITGWAQLNYHYGASIDDARRKLQFDIYYLLNQSVLLDVVIILQTVRVILWPQGVR